MDKVKIKLIEQLNNVVAQVEKLVTAEKFQSDGDFNVMKDEGERLLEIVEEYRKIAFPENNIKSSISALKDSLQQLQLKVESVSEPATADTAAVIVDAPAAPIVKTTVDEVVITEVIPVVNTTISAAIIEQSETPEVHEMEQPVFEVEQPVLNFAEISKPVEIEPAAQTITSTFQPLDRLRSLSEDKKSESSSTLHAIVGKLRSAPTMPEIHLEEPIDLRTSIGINEKFLFVNNLFKNSIRDCNEAMSVFNELDSLDTAMEKIHEYKEKYAWDEDSLAYLTFVEVINQRFSQLILA